MEKELFDVYYEDTNGKRINKPTMTKPKIEQPKDICPDGEKCYKLGERMSWKEFKSMPDDLKIAYIDSLVDNCGVTLSAISEVFEISYSYFKAYLYGIGYKNKGGWHMNKTPVETAKWKMFLDGKNYLKPLEKTEDKETACEEFKKNTVVTVDNSEPVMNLISSSEMRTDDVTIRLSGAFNPNAISAKLSELFEIGTNVSVLITICNEEGGSKNV